MVEARFILYNLFLLFKVLLNNLIVALFALAYGLHGHVLLVYAPMYYEVQLKFILFGLGRNKNGERAERHQKDDRANYQHCRVDVCNVR